MSTEAAEARIGRVEFTGSRHELLAIIVRGNALMVPSIGLYRFWQATWKRRFYWQNTVIDGDPLEYTGTPAQLLVGFFLALAFFLPIYVALFYFSMQDRSLTLVGDAAALAVLWFLSGYAIYRARDFRLSRTLWRGIRFNLQGSGWAYALRRFLWSVVMVATGGLAYPWMASSLWHYRWRNTWYGDRKFEIGGNWRTFAPAYFGTYLVNVAAIGATAIWIGTAKDFVRLGDVVLPGGLGLVALLGCIVILALSIAWYRTQTVSRMLSTVTLGDAKLTMKIGAAALFSQFVAYVLGLIGLCLVLGITGILTIAGLYATASQSGKSAELALRALFQSSAFTLALLIGTYLVVLGLLGLLREVVLGFGWWRLLARGAGIANPGSLRSVRATAEDRTLVGQGLADALNVGVY